MFDLSTRRGRFLLVAYPVLTLMLVNIAFFVVVFHRFPYISVGILAGFTVSFYGRWIMTGRDFPRLL